ncbi:MAG: hypothetical protein PF487_10150, partial [Bacteroidales bacterium]|nr:hypothetical protein [Bacteroidales bacterium]
NHKEIILNFNEIIDCEVKINEEVIQKSSASNIISGAIIAGGIGALIGSIISKKQKKDINYVGLVLTVNNIVTPRLNLCFSSGIMAEAKVDIVSEWHNVFKVIIERNIKNRT